MSSVLTTFESSAPRPVYSGGARVAQRAASHKPHIHKRHQNWRCFTHNATGEGETPEMAFRDWHFAQGRFERMQAARDPSYALRDM